MATIAKLVVSLGAQTASFETDMKRATRNQEKRMREMKKSAVQSGKAIAAAFAGVAAAMTGAVVSSTKTADSMGKLGQRLGASTESLSELAHVAKLSGVDFRTLEMGLQRMTRRIGEVAFLGKGEAKEALKVLGLEAKKLAELPLDKQFEAIAEELSKVENVSQRTSLAMKVFDAEGVRLVQMMEGGATSIQAMREEAQELGAVIGGDLVANSEQFNDNLTRMGALAQGASLQFTGGLLPALLGVQESILDNATGMNTFAAAGEEVGRVVIYLTRVFTVLWGILRTITAALLGMAVTIANAFVAIQAPIKATITGLANASKALAAGDFKAAMLAVKNIGKDSAKEFNAAMEGMERGIDEVVGSTIYFNEAMEKSGKISAVAADHLESTADSFDDLGAAADKTTKELEKLRAKYAKDQAQRAFTKRMERINTLFDEGIEIIDELVAEQEQYEASLEGILDALNPVEAAAEDFADQLAIITRHAREAGWSQDQLNEAVQKLTQSFDEQVASIRNTTDEFDLMATAIDEGVRILERSFQNMWENLLDGSTSVFEDIKSGFKSLLASLIHQATTQPILLNIQQGLQGTGTGPGGGINFQQLGSDLASFAAVIAGSELGGGGMGAVIGSAIGTAIGQAIIPIPVLGAVVGGIVGGLLGGFVDKIFGGSKTPRIGAGGFDIKPGDTQQFETIFGSVFVGDTKGGMDDFVAEFGGAIQDFDNALGSFLDDDQIGMVADALSGWSTRLRGDAITIEDLLANRFSTILSTFSEGLQAFVNKGADLTAQVDRLQVGVTAEKLFVEAPSLFGGRSLDQFLAVVEAFKSGNETIVDAYNEVLELLSIIGPVYESLKDFSGSDLLADFTDVLSGAEASLTEALAGMVSGLDDAIRDFDGSPEQLQNIGLMVASIREGEIKLLSQIDAIQKGISANLASLKADLLGLRDGPASDERLFMDAQKFINSISSATTPEGVAALERQFDAAIRAMSPESQMSNMTSILAMINDFSAAADSALEGMKQAVIDSGADTRAMVDAFIERIGSPIDLIASTNEAIAEALTGDSVESQNETHQDNVEGILEAGVSNISGEVANIGPVVADALRQALNGYNVNVAVNVEQGGLVTQ